MHILCAYIGFVVFGIENYSVYNNIRIRKRFVLHNRCGFRTRMRHTRTHTHIRECCTPRIIAKYFTHEKHFLHHHETKRKKKQKIGQQMMREPQHILSQEKETRQQQFYQFR